MELFKFNVGTSGDPTVLERGEAINKVESIMWVERYRDAGEFEIIAKLSSGLGEFLPIGGLISHADTYEVMIVENHEINESNDEDPTITITGRSFETFLENRIVGTNLVRASSLITEYELPAAYTWTQATKLINDHIVDTTNPDDALGNFLGTTTIPGTGVSEARVIPRGNVYQKLLEILAIDDLGIQSSRRNTFPGGNPTTSTLSVFKGADKSASIIFSWKSGDLSSVDYLFSDKKLKNSVMVVGRYINTIVDLGPVNYDRRMMILDANDIDGNFSEPPTGASLTATLTKMQTRGRAALKAQNRVTISRTDISKVTKFQYRRDYKVGDLITLDGNFGQMAVMRVVEYVEIEDENGESGHPTLELPGE
ncbi:MAG: hypothetical protein ABWY25_09705 [Paenisporosarcina sp.]